MKIKFSKFQHLICVVKTRIKGEWTLHHLIGKSLKMLMLVRYIVYDEKDLKVRMDAIRQELW